MKRWNRHHALAATLLASAATLVTVPAFAQSNAKVKIGFMLPYTGTYAAIGTAIDALIPGRTPLWRAGSSARSGGGLAINVSPRRRSAFVGWKIKR